MDIEELYTLFKQSTKVCTDTRNITDNCMFFALKGDNFNGNAFAEDALKKGANIAVIDEEIYHGKGTVLVEDVLDTLQRLARHHRKELGLPILALTGSNGKTTTKELIHVVLSKKYTTYSTFGNLNNHIGVPLTLLAMTDDDEFGIVEMGANHLNEIADLADIALPDYGYITNFGKAHLEGFGSLEGVVEAKTELYRHIKKYEKMLFVNSSDAVQLSRSEGINRILFGDSEPQAIRFDSANPNVKVRFDDLNIESNLIGAYNYSNIAAAIAIGNYFDIPSSQIKTAIESYIPTNNRSQIVQKGSNKVILDAYNANPTSMIAALENFEKLTDPTKVVILGDMFELGETSKFEHQQIANKVDDLDLPMSILIGKHFSLTEKSSSLVFKNYDEFLVFWETKEFHNTTFLIKASRGMALERIVDLI